MPATISPPEQIYTSSPRTKIATPRERHWTPSPTQKQTTRLRPEHPRQRHVDRPFWARPFRKDCQRHRPHRDHLRRSSPRKDRQYHKPSLRNHSWRRQEERRRMRSHTSPRRKRRHCLTPERRKPPTVAPIKKPSKEDTADPATTRLTQPQTRELPKASTPT